MFKKLFVTVLGTGVVAGMLFGSSAMSYLGTSCERVSDAVEDSVPVEFQIDRARKMVRDLEPEIRRSMHVIAKEEVEVAEIQKRIAAREEKAAKAKGDIMKLQADLSTGDTRFRYAGHTYSADEVKKDLARRFERFKTSDATLASLRDMRDARQRNLDAARQKLTAMMSSQRQLEVEVENLDAQLKLVEVAEASSDLQFDNSRLARAKKLMSDIRTRLDVASKLANADTEFHDEIQLDETAPEDISDQVAEYFGIGISLDAVAVSETKTRE
ncbi:MAG: hypothetical protein AAGA92_00330 [Planctomycetota bacterium]